MLFIAACGQASPPPAAPSGATTETEQPARLTVVVVIDQLAAHALDRYWDALPRDGALRQAAERGALHRRVVYPYAGTYTAPGHATIHTGVSPREHGILANSHYDRSRRAVVASVDDGEHPWLSDPTQFAGPAKLTADTVADRLRAATGGRGKVVALSVKDRGAVLPGGRRPDLALWFDPRAGRYTTSTHYAERPPDWLAAFHERHPTEALLTSWEASDPELLARYAGEDDAPGEGGWLGLGNTFPHDPRTTAAPLAAIMAMPQSSEHLLELAWEAAQALDLGGDDVPDLLSVSIASSDYTGHVFGPHSWEYLDNLLRIDRALRTLFDRLEERSRLSVLITSDHGVAPLPEAVSDEASRISAQMLESDVDRHLDEQLEEGDWVATVTPPFLYLSDWARAPERREDAVRVARGWLEARREVEAAYDTRPLAAVEPDTLDDPLDRAVARSITSDPDGDLFIVPARHFVFDPGMAPGRGTNHGSPWPYDREVPVLVWGPGVARQETRDPLPMTSTAPTVEALLGLPQRPSTAPLPGTPR